MTKDEEARQLLEEHVDALKNASLALGAVTHTLDGVDSLYRQMSTHLARLQTGQKPDMVEVSDLLKHVPAMQEAVHARFTLPSMRQKMDVLVQYFEHVLTGDDPQEVASDATPSQ